MAVWNVFYHDERQMYTTIYSAGTVPYTWMDSVRLPFELQGSTTALTAFCHMAGALKDRARCDSKTSYALLWQGASFV